MIQLIKSYKTEYFTTNQEKLYNKKIALSLEYSDKPEQLKQLLSELDIQIIPIGNAIDHEEYKDWSNEQFNERLVYLVKVKRDKKTISFKFCDSYNNAIENKKPDLYTILASIGSEYDFNTSSFEDFCSDFGYDTDSIKATKIYNTWVEHNKKLKTIFNDSDIEAMPH